MAMDGAALATALNEHLPIAFSSYAASAQKTGLVVVDEINGFCAVGAGALAPPAPDEQVRRMIEETDRLARGFAERRQPMLVFVDTHEPGKPEPPYPLHCEAGSGEEELVEELKWLERCPDAMLIRKDCIDGFVGGIEAVHDGRHAVHHNKVVDWINTHRLHTVLVVGICTDICVMDFVLTLLSARNHGMTPCLKDIVVYEPGTATYDLPRAATASLGLPETAAHPKAPTHHMGLYFMASRGAFLANALE